jgi:hypothetical protein
VPLDGILIISDLLIGKTVSSTLLSVDGQIAGLVNGPIWLTHGYHTLHLVGTEASSLDLVEPFTPNAGVQKITLGNSLTLQNTLVKQTDSALTVITAWHADKALNGDYHLFVHVVNTDGKPVAQYDNQPGRGAYPTRQWTANQAWTESDDLSLQNIPPGTYRIEIGWYSYPDMQRISVYADGPGAQDGLIYLGQITIGVIQRF